MTGNNQRHAAIEVKESLGKERRFSAKRGFGEEQDEGMN